MNFLATMLMLISSQASAEDVSHLRWEYWTRHTPDIVLCNDINISQEVIEKAVDRWRERGENIGQIIRKDCEERPRHGEIAIYADDDVPGNSFGVTRTTVYLDAQKNKTTSLAYARIWIKSYYLDSVILLEHEIGHGLGFKDTEDSSSIMSRTGAIY